MIFISKKFTCLHYFSWKFILILSIFLSSCTFNKKLITQKNRLTINKLWITHQQKLNKLKKFEIRGNFTYIGIDNKTYAKFFWQQYNYSNYRLLLTNPLGTTELELNVTPKAIKLMDKTGKEYINNHPAHMIYELTGMEIPTENLSDWLIGLPTNSISFTLNENGLLKTIKYRKNRKIWHLNYLSYHKNRELNLPSRLEIRQGKQRINLKMDAWTINE